MNLVNLPKGSKAMIADRSLERKTMGNIRHGQLPKGVLRGRVLITLISSLL